MYRHVGAKSPKIYHFAIKSQKNTKSKKNSISEYYLFYPFCLPPLLSSLTPFSPPDLPFIRSLLPFRLPLQAEESLDDLIDKLGGDECVAEMTGRKGRMIRHGDKFCYEHREKKGPGSAGGKGSSGDSAAESVNQGERKAFMTGKKLVAIISDAASTGISLRSSI
jgi:hypothetical protein